MNGRHDQPPPTAAERGRFVTFEGGEGAGKTTQLLRLAKRLGAVGISVTTTREPGGTPAAEAIRKFLLSGAARSLGPDAEALLFASARADHLDKLIRPALTQGSWVLCDRFTDFTRAYQGAAGVDPDLIEALERIAVWPTTPDLTLILDLPVEIGLVRAAARAAAAELLPDRFERDAVAEHQRRRRIFLEIAAAEPERCVVIDASRPEAEVTEIVWRCVQERLSVAEEPVDG